MKAVMLLSGGLDSRLAIRLMLDQGVELHALNHVTTFCTCTRRSSCRHEATKAAEEMGIPITVRNVTEDMLRIIEDPPHGHGSGVNPCIDCRILLFRAARELMDRIGARFVVTGEVVGERPMSQHRQAMSLIEREAGLTDLVVRPLCAHSLDPSIPEREGWVDRAKFKNITGRRRTPQIALATQLGIRDYPCPASGCRLTEPEFAARMRDLLCYSRPLALADVRLLKLGRHFRLSPSAKAVVGRDEAENAALLALRRDGDVMLELSEMPGPMTLVRGAATQPDLLLAAAITARYSKAQHSSGAKMRIRGGSSREEEELHVAPAAEDEVDRMRIGAQVVAGRRHSCSAREPCA